MTIPDKSSWGTIEKNDLDAHSAFDNFVGKSKTEAEEMFARNALYYQEDLLSMPAIAFNYYAPVFAKYILSRRAKEDSDGASSFMYLVLEILELNSLLATEEVKTLLIATAKTVSAQQDFYDADTDIYGQFSDQYNQIIQLKNRTS